MAERSSVGCRMIQSTKHLVLLFKQEVQFSEQIPSKKITSPILIHSKSHTIDTRTNPKEKEVASTEKTSLIKDKVQSSKQQSSLSVEKVEGNKMFY